MIKQVKKWLDNQLPFVIYRKPNQEDCWGWFQYDNQLNAIDELEKSCFVFAPFTQDKKVVFFPDDCKIIKDTLKDNITFTQEYGTLEAPDQVKNRHIQLVEKGITAIQEQKLYKVVLSRKEEVKVNKNMYATYFHRLVQKYPTAFVYWFFHPKVGMWMGATPEQLMQIVENKIKTVALAATQVDKGYPLTQVVWDKKEQEEQQIVTDFILDSLQPFVKSIKQSPTYTHRAGSLLHIKTDIEAILIAKDMAYKAVNAIHPTPALCGFPKEAARDFIIEHEGYPREYYGGFLGEWNFINGKPFPNSDLFVNLRCMKLVEQKAYLFLGGGVNKDSHPESEFNETVNKSKTIKSIL